MTAIRLFRLIVQKPSFNVEQILTGALFNELMRVETARDFQRQLRNCG
jgi:hypothetical protein